jgi:hypothetical protein
MEAAEAVSESCTANDLTAANLDFLLLAAAGLSEESDAPKVSVTAADPANSVACARFLLPVTIGGAMPSAAVSDLRVRIAAAVDDGLEGPPSDALLW